MLRIGLACLVTVMVLGAAEKPGRNPLDPRGQMHIPIGVADTVDSLKTFVEAEGSFSPGFGTYGIYFWYWDEAAQKLVAPTMDGVQCLHGLSGPGYLVPWSKWQAGPVQILTEVCEVSRPLQKGHAETVFMVAARATVSNTAGTACAGQLRVALRSLGPAGWPITRLDVSPDRTAILVEGHVALQSENPPAWLGVAATDLAERETCSNSATAPDGNGYGLMVFDLNLAPGEAKTFGFICPVLAGRRAFGHQ